MAGKLKRYINKNDRIEKNVHKKIIAAETTIGRRHTSNNEKKRRSSKTTVGRTIEFESRLMMDDKLKIQLLTSIAINLARPDKIPFVRLESIDTQELLKISENPDVDKDTSYSSYNEWMDRIEKSSTPKNELPGV